MVIKAFKGFFTLQLLNSRNLWICKMSKNYTHLSIASIAVSNSQAELLETGATQEQEIAWHRSLIHRSTISRELKRNVGSRGRGAGVYRTANAQSEDQSSSSRKADKKVCRCISAMTHVKTG